MPRFTTKRNTSTKSIYFFKSIHEFCGIKLLFNYCKTTYHKTIINELNNYGINYLPFMPNDLFSFLAYLLVFSMFHRLTKVEVDFSCQIEQAFIKHELNKLLGIFCWSSKFHRKSSGKVKDELPSFYVFVSLNI